MGRSVSAIAKAFDCDPEYVAKVVKTFDAYDAKGDITNLHCDRHIARVFDHFPHGFPAMRSTAKTRIAA